MKDALEAFAVVVPAAVAAAEATLRHVRAGDDKVDAVGVARQAVGDACVHDALQGSASPSAMPYSRRVQLASPHEGLDRCAV